MAIEGSDSETLGLKNGRALGRKILGRGFCCFGESFEWIMDVCFCCYRKTLFSGFIHFFVVNCCVDYGWALGFGKSFALFSGVCKTYDLLLGHCTLYFSSVYVVFLNFDVSG
eukprot:TRINITY_DN10455_c0_g1_i4.p1 TRINITY_DN10455_c0_g1~~TRINITY_DN10455_c0_g1_i4.p1  ORF type:complete len:112 (+),score=6.32 TRINITY_DN10455_c0_g1_i4:312-647(+)